MDQPPRIAQRLLAVISLTILINGCGPDNPTRLRDYSSCALNWITEHQKNDVANAIFVQNCMFAKGYKLTEDDKAVSGICRLTHNDSELCYRR